MSLLKSIALASIGSMLLSFAYPPYNMFYTAYFALSFLFLSLQYQRIWKSFLIGVIFVIIYFGISLLWTKNFHIFGWVSIVFIGSFIYIPLIFMYKVLNRYTIGFRYLTIPAAFVMFEFIKDSFSAIASFGNLSYSQSDVLPLIQIADKTGSYGITFLIVLFNYLIYRIIRTRLNDKKVLAHGIVIMIIFIAVLSYGARAINKYGDETAVKNKLTAAVYQPNISPQDVWDANEVKIVTTFEDDLKTVETGHIDFFIMPENLFASSIVKIDGGVYSDMLAYSLRKMNLKSPYVLLGRTVVIDGKSYNAAVLYDKDFNFINFTGKKKLAPFGEYFPFQNKFKIAKKLADYFGSSDFTPSKDQNVFDIKGIQTGTLICFESVFPDISRKYVKKGANLLIIITNDSWSKSPAGHEYHYLIGRFRAIETRTNVIRCGNSGISAIITPAGEEIYKSGILVKDLTVHNLVFYDFDKTFYVKHGDIFAFLCSLIVTLFLAYILFNLIMYKLRQFL